MKLAEKRKYIVDIATAVLTKKDSLSLLNKFGEKIWIEAQKDAANSARKNHKGNFPVCYTPYK